MSNPANCSPQVVLASASPRRRELFAALVSTFIVCEPDIPEVLGRDPVADARRLALAKAAVIAARYPDAVVVGADTVVHDGERHYGKPSSPAEAVAMLQALRGRRHIVVTGVAIIRDGEAWLGHSSSHVWLSLLDDSTIEAYVASGRPLDKAGAYAIQDDDVPVVSRWQGCYCGIVGLPLWLSRRGLTAHGIAAACPTTTYPRCATCPEGERA